jgi:cytochrome c-type biogenesis protein CcmF
MSTLGHGILYLDVAVCLYGIIASIYGARTNQSDWVDSGRRAVYTLAALSVIAFATLELAFLRNEFQFSVVANTSSLTTPTFYKLTAPWSSQQGSLLLWVTLSSLWSSLVLFLTRKRMREIAPYATSVLLFLAGFFACLAAFAANPFDTTATVPANGAGLDPLLMHPSMMFHPPMLYSGYTMMAIPLAFGVGALITGKLGSEWIRDTRRFALAGWLFLGVGIILGARWSYTELGWGGYWGWDAVENAALLPWLAITAFIHSIQIQEKRGMLKVWNVSLVMLAGILSIFGTFLVRSGVLDSIHAFGASTLGIPFVILLGVMFFSSIALVIWRRDSLKTEHRIDSLLSREAMFLLQNLVLLAMIFVIFWLTLFPLISEAITGTKVSVGPPTFAEFVVPLALVLVVLTGIGPMISWRRATVSNLKKHFVFPLAFAAVIAVLILAFTDAISKPLAFAMFVAAAFVVAAVIQEMYRGASARRALTGDFIGLSLFGLIRRNRRRYGGYIVHLGFAVLLVGVAASSSFQSSSSPTLKPGQWVMSDGYKWTYVKPTYSVTDARVSFGAKIDITRNGKQITTLNTSRSYYPAANDQDGLVGSFFDAGNADTTVALDSTPVHDFWAVVSPNLNPLSGVIQKGNTVFRNEYNYVVDVARKHKLTATQFNQLLTTSRFYSNRTAAVDEIAHQYVMHNYPVQFLMIVNPLVLWLWFGGIIMVIGALISMVPAAAFQRSRVRSLAPAGRSGIAAGTGDNA